MKRLASLFLIASFVLTSFFGGFSVKAQEKGTYLEYAQLLNEIGVFKGTGNGFELEKEPNRLEGAIMFVRLLGGEEEALANKYAHPFKDVPAWGSPYIGYLYHNGLTNGVSATAYECYKSIDAKSYVTFILRSLGYSDKQGDFTWMDALEFAYDTNLLDSSIYNSIDKQFLRDHVAKISYDALKTNVKNSNITLANKLVNEGKLSKAVAQKISVLEKEEDLFDDTDDFVIDDSFEDTVDDSIESLELSDDLSDIY